VKGEPVDISNIAEYAWYKWLEFRDTTTSFPVYKIQVGRYLDAAIDIGPTMARKILKANGKVTYHTSVISITTDDIQSPNELKPAKTLMQLLKKDLDHL
jgi:hypothetical protein